MVHKRYLFPCIHKIYKTFCGILINQMKEDSPQLDVCGEACCDSPGYSAKKGTYSLMEMVTSQVNQK